MITNWQVVTVPIFPSFGDPPWISRGPVRAGDEGPGAEGPRKIKVIVIDDETLIADTVVEILKEEGFDATSASSGDHAIELAETFRPDIVLSDVIMPGLNGIEVGIKMRDVVPNCKIILFSGQAATVDLLEKARQRGFRFDVLAKPIKPEQLISVIRANSGYRS